MRDAPESRLGAFFDRVKPGVEDALDRILPAASAPPAVVHEAMRYSVFAGGKRLRPVLALAAYSAFRPDWDRALPVAAALELVHTYSLIHDDLPAMDDDDFRRGQPSCHRKFGEAVAILAGDALLTLAFETIAGCPAFPPARIVEAVGMLARAAGTREGMIAGQVRDLGAQGAPVDPEALEAIHRAKTGALVEASLAIGAHLAGAGTDPMARLAAYGRRIGLAFQIMDDILDETAPAGDLGKTPGKDRAQEKATYPGLYGVEESRRMVRRITSEARDQARELGEGAGLLVEIGAYLESRTH